MKLRAQESRRHTHNPFVADPAMPEGIVPVASLPVEKEPCDSNVVNDSYIRRGLSVNGPQTCCWLTPVSFLHFHFHNPPNVDQASASFDVHTYHIRIAISPRHQIQRECGQILNPRSNTRLLPLHPDRAHRHICPSGGRREFHVAINSRHEKEGDRAGGSEGFGRHHDQTRDTTQHDRRWSRTSERRPLRAPLFSFPSSMLSARERRGAGTQSPPRRGSEAELGLLSSAGCRLRVPNTISASGQGLKVNAALPWRQAPRVPFGRSIGQDGWLQRSCIVISRILTDGPRLNRTWTATDIKQAI